MATVAYYIRSDYDADSDRERLLRETGQVPDTRTEEDVRETDPWQTESSFGPNRFTSAPSFVPAILSYEEINEAMGNGGPSSASGDGPCDVETKESELSGWYKSLNRRNAFSTGDPSSFSSSSSSPLPSTINNDASTRSSQSEPSRPKLQVRPRTEKDWFISNALEPPISTRPSPAPSTIVDMLDRYPPSQKPHVPPVWIAIDPSNRGFAMLQNSGWNEGEPLGSSFVRRNDHVPQQPPEKKVKEETKAKEVREVQEEVIIACEGFDDIAEVRRKTKDVIDLTVSDSSSSENEDDDGDELYVEPTRPSSTGPSLLDHGGKALLTPLPTVLKSDRLGIGLKAKTVGPYKASQKRVTHNAAAMAAHVRANEDLRKMKAKVGRGGRGFSRINKREMTNRKRLLAYLNE
jgi:hypothetical protein